MSAWLWRASAFTALLAAGWTGGVFEAETNGADSVGAAAADQPAPPALRHGVFRYTSYPAAWTAAQKSNRPILVFACSPACPNCTRMLGETFKAPQIRQFVGETFETVYVDKFEQPELTAKLGLRWYPTTLVVGTDNKVIDVIEGYVDPAAFAHRLQTTLASQATATQTR